jgi:hypothetical protein
MDEGAEMGAAAGFFMTGNDDAPRKKFREASF